MCVFGKSGNRRIMCFRCSQQPMVSTVLSVETQETLRDTTVQERTRFIRSKSCDVVACLPSCAVECTLEEDALVKSRLAMELLSGFGVVSVLSDIAVTP